MFSTIVTAVTPEVRRAAGAEGDSAEIEERSSDAEVVIGLIGLIGQRHGIQMFSAQSSFDTLH